MRISKSPVNGRVILVLISLALALLALPLLASALSPAQAPGQKKAGANNVEGETPAFSQYRGVQIGMTAEEARKKLGHLKDKGDKEDFFIFSDNETAQVRYDSDKKVATVSVDFMSGAADVPLAKAVMGSDVEAKPDGSVYKLVRYPKAGYWVSYSKTAGDSPLVSVTIQKIQ